MLLRRQQSPSVKLDTVLRNYHADLVRFFQGRFGRDWFRALRVRGVCPMSLYLAGRGSRRVSSRVLQRYEDVAVKLGFIPYVGRHPHPFERNSRAYWNLVCMHSAKVLYIPTARPNVASLARDFMVHRIGERPHSDLMDEYPINPQPLTQAGNGICSPMPALRPEVERFEYPDNDNGSRSHATGTGGQTIPPNFAQSSERAKNSCSRPSFCSLQEDSLTASCL